MNQNAPDRIKQSVAPILGRKVSYKSGVLGTELPTAAKFVVSLGSAPQFLLPVLTWMSPGSKDPDLLTVNEKLSETIVKPDLEN